MDRTPSILGSTSASLTANLMGFGACATFLAASGIARHARRDASTSDVSG